MKRSNTSRRTASASSTKRASSPSVRSAKGSLTSSLASITNNVGSAQISSYVNQSSSFSRISPSQYTMKPVAPLARRSMFNIPSFQKNSVIDAVTRSFSSSTNDVDPNAKQLPQHLRFNTPSIHASFESLDAHRSDPNEEYPKLTNVVRGSSIHHLPADTKFNIVGVKGGELNTLDKLPDGTHLRIEPSQFSPVNFKHVPNVNELSSERDSYQHHNELLRERAKYAISFPLEEEDKDNIDTWYRVAKPYLWAPTSQDYQTIPSRARIKLIDSNGLSHGRGGRKNSAALASIKPGTGRMFVNGVPYTEYFRSHQQRSELGMPFYVTGTVSQFDVMVKVRGGGLTGQSGAAAHAVANALQNFEPQFRPALKVNGLLKRDPRVVERKHAGRKKARKSFAWVKR